MEYGIVGLNAMSGDGKGVVFLKHGFEALSFLAYAFASQISFYNRCDKGLCGRCCRKLAEGCSMHGPK